MTTKKAEVIRCGLFSCQACIPRDWTDEQAVELAESENPCGTEHGWQIRKSGKDERVQCASRSSFVHVMLDA